MYVKKIILTGFFVFLLVILCTLPVLAYSSDATDLYAQGNLLMKNKNYTQAVAAYEKATSIAPDYYEAWNSKADALNRAQLFKDALAASDKTLS